MFYLNNKLVNAVFQDDMLTIENEERKLIVSIEVRYILRVSLDNQNLAIKYVVRKRNDTLKIKDIILNNYAEFLQTLFHNIDDSLKALVRPKRLLVIINPNSGKRKGIKIYQQVAAPLFQYCDVKADVIVTRKQKEPTDILKNYNLSHVDGIVTVGGDGLYCECMNGLLSKVQRDSNVDLHNHTSDIVKTNLPIGIVPAGSGDYIVQYLHGTRCARTAVLHILLGRQVKSNVVSVHEGGRLLSYSALVLGFGLFGDMMHDSEKCRWMGPARYSIVPLGCLLKRREIYAEIEYQTSGKESVLKRTQLLGRQISLPNGKLSLSRLSRKQRTKSTSDLVKGKGESEECVNEKGQVYGVDSHAIMMKEKFGKMTPRFGQDSLMVYTTHKCTLSDHISQLTKVKNEQPDCYDYKFVSVHEVSSYRVRLLNATVATVGRKQLLQKDFYINCDGEVIRLKEPMFDVKLHRKAVTFYGDVAD